MIMKSLVLGGTGFIGRRLVEQLLSSGNEVTLATSGKSPNPFEGKASTIITDRFNRESLEKSMSDLKYHDVVYDTIGYRSVDIKNSLNTLKGKFGKYVYISSAAVYRGMEGTLSEGAFDPTGLVPDAGEEDTYHGGKRMSEAYLVKNSPVPIAIVRFPNVIGYDDSTLRFQDHVSRILKGDEFKFQEPEGKRNHVWVEDAGKFLAWLGQKGNGGIFNAASPDSMKGSEFVTRIAESLGTSAKLSMGKEEPNSRYAASKDMIVSVEKAQKKGFSFTPTNQWLKAEAQKARDYGKKSPNSMEYTRSFFS